MNVLPTTDPEQPAWLRLVREQVDNTRFGVVQIVIHDRRVVQVETTEKVRFDRETTPHAD